MKLVIDTREQDPLDFKTNEIVSEVTFDALPFGDYWTFWESGEAMPIAWERKNLSDLFGTLTSGMERFKKEIARANENKFKLVIVIEGSLSEVVAGTKYSTISGLQIIKTLNTIWVKYGVEHKYCNNRAEMKKIILDGAEAIGRNFKPTSAFDTFTASSNPS